MKILLTSPGFWYGLFGINLFMFVMTVEAFGAGVVGIHLPLLNLGSAALCLFAAHQYKGEDYDEPDT